MTRLIPTGNVITKTTSLPGIVHVVLNLGIAPAAHTETRGGTTGATTAPVITSRHALRGDAGADHLMTTAAKITATPTPLPGKHHATTTTRGRQIFKEDSGETGTPASPETTNSLDAPAPVATTDDTARNGRTGETNRQGKDGIEITHPRSCYVCK